MKRKLIIATGAALGILSAAAHAQSGYAGISVGSAEQKKSIDLGLAPGGPSRTNDTTTAFKLLAGYQFNPTFGAEAGWVRHGDSDLRLSGTIARLKPESIYAAGTASLPLGLQFALFGKLGVARNRLGASGSLGASDTRPFAGAGLSYAFTQALSGVVEYEDFGKLADGRLEAKSRIVSAGLRAAF